ncbi:MAG: thioredoxin domain-containing protein [Pyrinomonadaceae bacterium]
MRNKFWLLMALTLGLSIVSFAQDTMKKDEMKTDEMSKESMMKDDKMMDKRPVVVAIRADWCPYCKKLEPVMMELMKDYSEKLNFVVFDITNEKTIAASKQLAKEKGLEEFFDENKDKSAFVAILKENKQVFSAKYNTKREAYVEAFDKALQK